MFAFACFLQAPAATDESMFKVEVEPLYAPKLSKEEKKAAAKAKREARKAAKEAAKAKEAEAAAAATAGEG